MSAGSEDAPALDLQRIIKVLDRHCVEYVVVGGVAARLHGARRMTMDVDV
jgi:diphthamide synthase (EF-2-diphthine--ammonia ligase)